ncbi:hypothetical protein GQR58_024176 [Nymphon striatum]|nr:hypothetical protein GQR58_024176 [Nymphon striatum]
MQPVLTQWGTLELKIQVALFYRSESSAQCDVSTGDSSCEYCSADEHSSSTSATFPVTPAIDIPKLTIRTSPNHDIALGASVLSKPPPKNDIKYPNISGIQFPDPPTGTDIYENRHGPHSYSPIQRAILPGLEAHYSGSALHSNHTSADEQEVSKNSSNSTFKRYTSSGMYSDQRSSGHIYIENQVTSARSSSSLPVKFRTNPGEYSCYESSERGGNGVQTTASGSSLTSTEKGHTLLTQASEKLKTDVAKSNPSLLHYQFICSPQDEGSYRLSSPEIKERNTKSLLHTSPGSYYSNEITVDSLPKRRSTGERINNQFKKALECFKKDCNDLIHKEKQNYNKNEDSQSQSRSPIRISKWEQNNPIHLSIPKVVDNNGNELEQYQTEYCGEQSIESNASKHIKVASMDKICLDEGWGSDGGHNKSFENFGNLWDSEVQDYRPKNLSCEHSEDELLGATGMVKMEGEKYNDNLFQSGDSRLSLKEIAEITKENRGMTQEQIYETIMLEVAKKNFQDFKNRKKLEVISEAVMNSLDILPDNNESDLKSEKRKDRQERALDPNDISPPKPQEFTEPSVKINYTDQQKAKMGAIPKIKKNTDSNQICVKVDSMTLQPNIEFPYSTFDPTALPSCQQSSPRSFDSALHEVVADANIQVQRSMNLPAIEALGQSPPPRSRRLKSKIQRLKTSLRPSPPAYQDLELPPRPQTPKPELSKLEWFPKSVRDTCFNEAAFERFDTFGLDAVVPVHYIEHRKESPPEAFTDINLLSIRYADYAHIEDQNYETVENGKTTENVQINKTNDNKWTIERSEECVHLENLVDSSDEHRHENTTDVIERHHQIHNKTPHKEEGSKVSSPRATKMTRRLPPQSKLKNSLSEGNMKLLHCMYVPLMNQERQRPRDDTTTTSNHVPYSRRRAYRLVRKNRFEPTEFDHENQKREKTLSDKTGFNSTTPRLSYSICLDTLFVILASPVAKL